MQSAHGSQLFPAQGLNHEPLNRLPREPGRVLCIRQQAKRTQAGLQCVACNAGLLLRSVRAVLDETVYLRGETIMTLDEIKSAIESGHRVFWSNSAYEVLRNGSQFLIVCNINNHAIGLTWLDGVTMNGKPEDFFVGAPK
jgi:hypothetical protein